MLIYLPEEEGDCAICLSKQRVSWSAVVASDLWGNFTVRKVQHGAEWCSDRLEWYSCHTMVRKLQQGAEWCSDRVEWYSCHVTARKLQQGVQWCSDRVEWYCCHITVRTLQRGAEWYSCYY